MGKKSIFPPVLLKIIEVHIVIFKCQEKVLLHPQNKEDLHKNEKNFGFLL